jgi:hypothetical protein
MPPKSRILRRAAGGFSILALWILLLAVGFGGLLRYEGASSPFKPAPASDGAPHTNSEASLIIALHPKCPCSRASVAELFKIYSHATNKFKITVLAYKPAAEADSWIETDSIRDLRRVHANIVVDRDGAEAAHNGMTTSGQVILYDATGNLVFNGGITSSRGHQGDNFGEQAALDQINGVSQRLFVSKPVFGCSLQ